MAIAAMTDDECLVRQIWQWLDDVPDPEIPVVSVIDLGMIRDVCTDGSSITVSVSPTYSGCPATEVIEESVARHIRERGFTDVTVERVLSPAWTTDWITEAGREKLRDYGIVPPETDVSKRELLGRPALHCPRCQSERTTLLSQFGSTACKASYRCEDCLEPFEYFKCI